MTAIVFMLAALPLLLLSSAFFSGSETALFSLSHHERSRLRRSNTVVGSTICTLLAETRALLITLLLGNMTINVLYFAIASMVAIQLRANQPTSPLWPVTTTIAALLSMILIGEVLPKLVAARLPLSWAKLIAVPMLLIHRGITPIRMLASQLIISPLARIIAPPTRPPMLGVDELESLLHLSQLQGVIDSDEQLMLQQVLQLSQIKVRDLMVPRVDIRGFDLNEDPNQLAKTIRQTRLRYVPVYQGDLDHIVGIISSQLALLRLPRYRHEIETMLAEPRFVPEQQRADRLLAHMRQTGETIAIIVDEYGGTAGLVTLEDVVEHLVGDIAGPYHTTHGPKVDPLGKGRYRVDANLSVHDWPQLFGRHHAMHNETAIGTISTVGGLVMALIGRVPRPDDRVHIGNLVITVDKMNESRLASVIIELQNDEVRS